MTLVTKKAWDGSQMDDGLFRLSLTRSEYRYWLVIPPDKLSSFYNETVSDSTIAWVTTETRDVPDSTRVIIVRPLIPPRCGLFHPGVSDYHPGWSERSKPLIQNNYQWSDYHSLFPERPSEQIERRQLWRHAQDTFLQNPICQFSRILFLSLDGDSYTYASPEFQAMFPTILFLYWQRCKF